MKRLIILLAVITLSQTAAARELPDRKIARIDSLMTVGLMEGYYPGASIAVGTRSGISYAQTYGYQDHTHQSGVSPDDVYDIASLTKVVATTFAVMRLYDLGQLDLNAPVGSYIDTFRGTLVDRIPVSQLLTHTSGLPYFPAYCLIYSNPTGGPYVSRRYDKELYPHKIDTNYYLAAQLEADTIMVSDRTAEGFRRMGEHVYVNQAIDTVIAAKITESHNPDLSGKYNYSDTNFYILRMIIERITGQTLDRYTAVLFDEMGMTLTGYLPLDRCDTTRVVPTEDDLVMGRGYLRGYVHDDLAAMNGGVEGNAGVFSCAGDLARFCTMMLNYGRLEGKQIISRSTVQLFTSSPLSSKKIYRGLGFDKRKAGSSLSGGYGHTGFTGTMIWIDPGRDLFMVFLSNRVNPSRANNGLSESQLRTKLWEIIIDPKA